MEQNKKFLQIEVVYATPLKQHIVQLEVEEKTTILEAIHRSNICNIFPEIDLSQQKVGIFGKIHNLSDFLKDKDRIEIYRPLLIDPKLARLAKVSRGKKS